MKSIVMSVYWSTMHDTRAVSPPASRLSPHRSINIQNILNTLIQKSFSKIIKITNFWGGLTNISAKKALKSTINW